jgi:NAD(P)H-dependent FMN reductase
MQRRHKKPTAPIGQPALAIGGSPRDFAQLRHQNQIRDICRFGSGIIVAADIATWFSHSETAGLVHSELMC